MVKVYNKIRFLPEVIFLIFLLCSANLLFAVEENSEEWQIVVSDSLLQDEAVKVAIDDLQNTGSSFGIDFKIAREGSIPNTPAILVGDALKNKVTARMVKKGLLHLSGIDDEQGYEIRTVSVKRNRVIVIAGGSVIGDVYGLYRVRDRLLVHHEIPDINIVKIPELKIRSTIMGLTKENMRKALQFGINWVGGGRLNDLVPWGVDPEDSRSKQNREQFKELIDYAHALHLTVFIYTDEFTYHPNLLKEFGASLSPEDPLFWDAFQAKFRRFLKVLPEIDGIMFRTGEFTLAGESEISAYDLMHGQEDDSDWSLEKRYRTFIQKAHEVIVGEFDKIYFHRTWVTNSYEQHSKGQVYKKIFTDEVPLKNLYLSPYINAHDRWFFTAYNPTFNITSHNMIALLARMDYHTNSNVHIFPTFSGQYFQAALKGIQYHPDHNLKGVQIGMPGGSGSSTTAIMNYTSCRLAWDHLENLNTIVTDYASIHYGRKAAEQMAELFQLSASAYKYGIYIEPATYSIFNTLPHIRLTTFPVFGFPAIDKGKQHIDFLYDIYLKCKPWKTETIMYLDHGLFIAGEMMAKYQNIKANINSKENMIELENSLLLMRNLIKSNNMYVKSFIAYFDYRADPIQEHKTKLADLIDGLKSAIEEFQNTPGYVYHLFGINQLIINAEQALYDLENAETILANAPKPSDIKKTIAEQQQKYQEILLAHRSEAIKVLHWEGKVDGRDIVEIKGDQVNIKHLRWDPAQHLNYEVFEALPARSFTVIPDDLFSRSMHPFVLEQPGEENNYTAKIYLFDEPGGGDWVKFDLYYIPESPKELELEIPWNK